MRLGIPLGDDVSVVARDDGVDVVELVSDLQDEPAGRRADVVVQRPRHLERFVASGPAAFAQDRDGAIEELPAVAELLDLFVDLAEERLSTN